MSGLPKRRPGKTRRYAPAVENPAAQRLIIKVASLYHTHGLRQKEIADRLAISQSRVSRLLTQAEEVGIVRTVVAVPLHLHAGLEDAVEREYDVDEVHVVESVGSTNAALRLDLGVAAAAILGEVSLEAATVGWTSWSRTLRAVVDNLLPLHLGTKHVVEMVGDLGAPALQHEAAASTQRLARLLGAEPVFLRTPGVVSSRAVPTRCCTRTPSRARPWGCSTSSTSLCCPSAAAPSRNPCRPAGTCSADVRSRRCAGPARSARCACATSTQTVVRSTHRSTR